jgi:rifampin ADP-ribosyltransferase
MSAQDNMNPQQFFHGSRADLNVGDMIEPGMPGNWAASSRQHVYFTPDEKVAHGFARRIGKTYGEDDPPHVYTVEPTGKYTNDRDYEGPAFKSKSPLRVTAKREVS